MSATPSNLHHPISYSVPTAQPCVRQRLAHLNHRIERTRGEIGRLRCQLADKRMLLNVECQRRARLSAQVDRQFLDTITDQTLEAALSRPGPLVEKLATGMKIAATTDDDSPADDYDPSDPPADVRAADDALHAHLDATNGWDSVHGEPGVLRDPTKGDGDHLPTLEPDPEFAEQIVRESTAEVNQALADYARHVHEQEAMAHLHSDEMCDSSGEA